MNQTHQLQLIEAGNYHSVFKAGQKVTSPFGIATIVERHNNTVRYLWRIQVNGLFIDPVVSELHLKAIDE